MALAFLSGCRANNQHAGHEMNKTYDWSPVTSAIQHWVDRGYYKGCGIVVVKDDCVVLKQTFGNHADDTVVLIASSGKWLAAAAIAVVVDEGKLTWDTRVEEVLPEFVGKPTGQATLRQLLSHTSGFEPYQPKGNPRDDYQTLSESVAHIVPLPAKYPPGTQFEYGGLALQVAGRMAEKVTGQDWKMIFQTRIAERLGMRNTHFTPVDLGGGHSPMLGGGARSTLADYILFLEMIHGDGLFRGQRVISAASIHEMQADQVRQATVKQPEFPMRVRGSSHTAIYGLGEWREIVDSNGNATLLSSPSWAGAYPWVDRTHHLYGIFLAHVEAGSVPVKEDHFDAFHTSPMLYDQIRQAISK